MSNPLTDKSLFNLETLPDIVEIKCNISEEGCPIYLKRWISDNVDDTRQLRFETSIGFDLEFMVGNLAGLEIFLKTLEMLLGKKFTRIKLDKKKVIYWRRDYAEKVRCQSKGFL